MSKLPRRRDRGFTLVEIMIVLGVMGIMASIAIPNYQKLTARGYRSEMVTAIGKFKFFFKNAHDNNATFATSDVPDSGGQSQVNPDPTLAALGIPAQWDGKRTGWKDMPFGLEGGIRMRYYFQVNSPDEVEFEACGNFPSFGPLTVPCGDMGINGNYFYDEKVEGDGTNPPGYPAELPAAF
ncbi:MAG TPA: prepilin-type N-terminal cleavage/methylation domain-containing protein [Myxococcales bacterium]|nr:prepilin-type N-terminal cleavage/methylation domain-containing protein [Myxococcales bacterium]